jgi:hypothetical protein
VKGQSFLSDNEETLHGQARHLNIVVSDADQENSCLVVSVTTWREKDGRPFRGQDSSCILEANCHPFIKHKSWVYYARSRQMSLTEILIGIWKGLIVKKEAVSEAVLTAIQEGAKKSPHIREELTRFFDYF